MQVFLGVFRFENCSLFENIYTKIWNEEGAVLEID